MKALSAPSQFLTITVPLVPPGVNHYVKHTRTGRHYVTGEAKAFKAAFAVCAAGRQVHGDRYAVAFTVYLGRKQKGDADNFSKVLQDAMVDAGVICTDARVYPCIANKDRDWDNPRTVIHVCAIPKDYSLADTLDCVSEWVRESIKEVRNEQYEQ